MRWSPACEKLTNKCLTLFKNKKVCELTCWGSGWKPNERLFGASESQERGETSACPSVCVSAWPRAGADMSLEEFLKISALHCFFSNASGKDFFVSFNTVKTNKNIINKKLLILYQNEKFISTHLYRAVSASSHTS